MKRVNNFWTEQYVHDDIIIYSVYHLTNTIWYHTQNLDSIYYNVES